MLDPCALAQTQFFVMRDDNENAIGIAEIPKVAGLPTAKFTLPMMLRYSMEPHYTHVEWANDPNSGGGIKVDFWWKDWICEERDPSTGAATLFADSLGITLDPVDRDEAENILILTGVDYYRAIKAKKPANTSPLDIELIYVGKMDPQVGQIPTVPDEPRDSHIIPSMRPSRLQRIAREKAKQPVDSDDGGDSKVLLLTLDEGDSQELDLEAE